MSLTNQNLLQNYTNEAGLSRRVDASEQSEPHGGWESPFCQLRGHFLGHWLSAAAMHIAATGDVYLKGKADDIIATLALCQKENGGEWVGSIPEKYLDWIARGKSVWAPHYTLHKTLMGLLDMYEMAGNEQALSIAINFAKWFTRWSAKYTREEFDNILDVETGGMLEVWVQLYNITKDPEHKALVDRYYRARLFEPLLKGEDVLTNMHANTTIPEIMGAALAYEVTGEQKWMDIVKAYWEFAVVKRGTYATGGQTCGEIWTPMFDMGARLGDKNQEHCTVYNMMRVAEFLLRHTGEAVYADYWERNLYNGIMAQGFWDGHPYATHGMTSDNPLTGLLTYFLPLRGGAKKGWASKTQDFFCCHGTLVQANAAHNNGIYYHTGDGISVCQYIDSDMTGEIGGVKVTLSQTNDTLAGSHHISSDSTGTQAIGRITNLYPHDPDKLVPVFTVKTEKPVEFTLKLRIPSWIKSAPVVRLNGEILNVTDDGNGYYSIKRTWGNDTLVLELQKGITVLPLPGDESRVAFLDGPVVLAGLVNEERILYAENGQPLEALITPDNEREWSLWRHTYRSVGQDFGFRLWPLYMIGYERYSVYFPVKYR